MKAVIFDMDGVIVDSEPSNMVPILEYVRHYNPKATEEDLYGVVGRGKKDAWKVIANAAGNIKAWDDMFTEYNKDWKSVALKKNIDYKKIFRKDVKRVIDYAKKIGMKTAVASSTEYKKVEFILRTVGIFEDMDVVISGEDCIRPKPDPFIYLETARRLGIDTAECCVIEDSTTGIAAAHAAGMFVAALIDNRFDFDRSASNVEISSVADLLPILKSGSSGKTAQRY